MPEPLLILVVETSLRVPGLGVLAVPAAPAAAQLMGYDLHTSLAIRLLVPGQPAQAVVATVEEVAQHAQPTRRALLLDADPGEPLPTGTQLHVIEIVDLFPI